jgi:hypothetical protein
MRKALTEALESVGAPPPEFWESELEMNLEHAFLQLREEGRMETWVEKRKGREAKVLLQNCGIATEVSSRKNKETLRACNGHLLQYALVDYFRARKLKQAIIDVATKHLTPEEIEPCRAKDGYDVAALLYALYHKDPKALRDVFLLDKFHKSGFARMVLDKNIRRPEQPLSDFLTPEYMCELLQACDLDRNDGRTSELKDIRSDDDRYSIYIRRADRPEMIVGAAGVLHGYKPEWIILNFLDGGKRVNIASTSIKTPVHIANRLAHAYFQQPCEYINQSKITTPKQIERLFSLLKDGRDENLTLVALTVKHSPLEGQPRLTIESSEGIGDALFQFERQVGDLLSSMSKIEKFNLVYRKKKVHLKLEHVDAGVVVRYSDGKLNLSERKQFETYMEKEHGITALSTEKRSK